MEFDASIRVDIAAFKKIEKSFRVVRKQAQALRRDMDGLEIVNMEEVAAEYKETTVCMAKFHAQMRAGIKVQREAEAAWEDSADDVLNYREIVEDVPQLPDNSRTQLALPDNSAKPLALPDKQQKQPDYAETEPALPDNPQKQPPAILDYSVKEPVKVPGEVEAEVVIKKLPLEKFAEIIKNPVWGKLKEGLGKIGEKFGALAAKGKSALGVIGAGASKVMGGFSKLKEKIGGLSIIQNMKQWAGKGFSFLKNALQEGLGNLANYTSGYGSAMQEYQSQTEQFKNTLATAFEPIAVMIMPYITQLIGGLTAAGDVAARFLSALTGKNTYTKAKKQVKDYTKAVSEAGDATGGALASFDDINVLGGGAQSATQAQGASQDAFEIAEIDDSTLAWAGEFKAGLEPAIEALGRLKEGLEPLKSFVAEGLVSFFENFLAPVGSWVLGEGLPRFIDGITKLITDIDWETLKGALDGLWQTLAPFAINVGEGLLWLFENVLVPLQTWVISDALPAFINLLSAALDGFNRIVEVLKPAFEYIWNNFLLPIGQFTGEIFLWAIDTIKLAIEEFTLMFEENGGYITNILTSLSDLLSGIWEVVVKPVLQFIMGGVKTLVSYIGNIIGNLIQILSGVIDFFAGVFTGDMERAWNGIVDIFKGAVNFLANILEGLVNMVINGLNFISIDVPEWVPLIGGKHFGFNIPKFEIPRMATGGIVTRPTAALIGEAGREAVLPLENNTQWMDTLAQRLNDRTITINFTGSMAEFVRQLKPVLDQENRRVGVRLMTV